MGIYSSDRIFGGYDAVNVPTNEAYFGINGGLNAIIDIENNNHALFESLIGRDFQEARMIHEGADVESLMYFNEATLGGIFDKIKTMVMKIWEKIKGIFSTFLKKLDGVILKDNKKLVEKYRKEIMNKDLSKMKYKIQTRQDDKFKALTKIMTSDTDWVKEANRVFRLFGATESEYNKIKDQVNDGEYQSQVIENVFGVKNIELNEMAKEMHEQCFDPESSEEGVSDALLNDIMNVMKGDKVEDNVKKAQTAANKHFKKLVSNLDDMSSQISKKMNSSKDAEGDNIEGLKWKYSGKDLYKKDLNDKQQAFQIVDKYDGTNPDGSVRTKKAYADGVPNITNARAGEYSKRATLLSKAINQIETVHTNAITCFLNENKFNVTQSRKIWMKAASYNDKKAKNEAFEIYLDAVEEAAEYEITSLFEDYSLSL